MSGIAAILSFCGSRDPALDLIEPMLGDAAHLGSAEGRRWQVDSVAIGFCLSATVPEEARSPQPLVAAAERYVLAADLRLDNREELLAQLRQGAATQPSSSSDAALVLACYQAWGTAAFARLVGDYALVLWDGVQRKLVCAGDALAQRPLYYHANARRFVCGSAIRQLFCAADTPRRLAPQAVADYLTVGSTPPGTTVFEGIRWLPAGHFLEVRPDGRLQLVRYWDPTTIGLVDGAEAAWYAEQFRDRFVQAVQARLRGSPRRIGVHLSGGFDSTAVVAAVCQRNHQLRLGLEPWAFRSLAEHPAADERRYMEVVLAHYPMPVETTAFADYWAFQPVPVFQQWQDEPGELPYVARVAAELVAARERGIKVILTGEGGDEIGGSSWYLLDLLVRGKLRRWWPELKARAAGKRRSPLGLLQVLLWNLSHRLRRRWTWEPRRPPRWINTTFARRWHLHRRVRNPPRFYNPIREETYDRLRVHWEVPLLRTLQPLCNHFGVELRSPFLDRRLFEWALMVPTFRLGEHGRVKAPLRRALADWLPPAIATRADKGDYRHYWDLGLRERERPRILKMLERPISAELGYVDAGALRQSYAGYCRGEDINRGQLWHTLTLEAWLRNPHVAAWLGL
jgi:asparagine synthase (glutamine-hydrolysing)